MNEIFLGKSHVINSKWSELTFWTPEIIILFTLVLIIKEIALRALDSKPQVRNIR